VRRLEVPLTIRLDRLHLVLQAAIGWTNSHLYEIRARDVAGAHPIGGFVSLPADLAAFAPTEASYRVLEGTGPWDWQMRCAKQNSGTMPR